MIAGNMDGTSSEELSSYGLVSIAACVVFVAFVLPLHAEELVR